MTSLNSPANVLLSQNRSDLPSLGTYLEIVKDTVDRWSDCKIWAIEPYAVDIVFYMSVFFVLLYLYVVVIIVYKRMTTKLFHGSFYNCVILLAIGDIGTVITCSRVTIPACSLKDIAARYIAWEAIGVFCVDLIYGVNLVMSLIRLNAIFNFHSNGTKDKINKILNLFLIFELVWSLTMGILYFNGFIKKIWFEDVKYLGEFLFPFNYFRTEYNCAKLGITFVIYVVAFIKLRMVYIAIKPLAKQCRFLVLAVLIFICELLFIYSSDWFGSAWGIGDDVFNAHVSYFGRPIATGITPIFYIIFSSEVRRACFWCGKEVQEKRSVQSVTVAVITKRSWQRLSTLPL